MRRSVLLTLAALGGVISLIGGVGLFSALTDTARTGTNSAESGALAASADIQLATATEVDDGGITCGEFVENLTTPFFTLSNVQPATVTSHVYFCLKNAGSQPVALTAGVDDLTDIETGCTGDEALFDQTCSPMALGELSDVLHAQFFAYSTCGSQQDSTNTGQTLKSLANSPIQIGFIAGVATPLAVGETRCFSVSMHWPSPASQSQQAQSDQVTWRFRFDAQA